MQISQKINYLPHLPAVLMFIKLLFIFLLGFFFIIPFILKVYPGVIVHVAFLNHLRWPLFVNLSDPRALELNGTRHFAVKTHYASSIGTWHILPEKDELNMSSQMGLTSLKSAEIVVLYLHGNAGTRAGWHRIQLYKVLSKLGLHVIAFDYRGYGDSNGYPSENGLVEDSIYMFNYIRTITNASIFIWGHSLGTGVAIKTGMLLNLKGIKFDGLILESPFSNFIDASNNHPFSLPIRSLPWFSWAFTQGLKNVGIEFDSEKSISKVNEDILILHAKDDGIVPFKLGYKLYESALRTKKVGSVELITFEEKHGYGHKHIHKSPELPNIIRKFINRKVFLI